MVLQFAAGSLADHDRLVSFEAKLTKQLEGTGIVDGHDFGLGTINIFHTNAQTTALPRILR